MSDKDINVSNKSEDTISRQAAIDALDAICERECEYSKPQRAVMCGACRLGSAFDVIDEQPTIDPVRRGRWVKAERDGCLTYSEAYKQCSECGKVTFLAEKMNYCPNCGADMRGEQG